MEHQDSYLAEERNLRDRRMYTPNLSQEQQAQIDQRLADLKVEKEERIRIAEATYAELDQLQTKWELGASFALQNYVDQAANVAQQTADAFTNAFKGMEDALVNL
jgi:lambda family phage tail tape measure protein